MSDQTDLLVQVTDVVNTIGRDERPEVGEHEINNHVQSIVDDPDGKVIMSVADGQVTQAMIGSLPLVLTGGEETYQQFLIGLWMDGFLIGAEYMRKRMEEGL
jgi:hypothetical protein